MNFSERVRDELAHLPAGPECCVCAETAVLVRLAGSLVVGGGAPPQWVVSTAANAVARRVHAALARLFGLRVAVEVHAAAPLRAARYRLALPAASAAAHDLGVVDAAGRIPDALPRRPGAGQRRAHDTAAALRGALLAGASLSDPRRPAHLEIGAPGKGTARDLQRLLAAGGAPGAACGPRDVGWRVYSKSGAGIGAVLARAGAHAAFLEWDGARLRRELRGDANRAANADRANLARGMAASWRQVAAIEALMAHSGWDELGGDLRSTALVRLANPLASLGELARLHDPPVHKATVSRRLARLSQSLHTSEPE